MRNPLSMGEKLLSWIKKQDKHVQFLIKNCGMAFVFFVVVIYGSVFRFWDSRPVFYAEASYSEGDLQSPLLEKEPQIFSGKAPSKSAVESEKDRLTPPEVKEGNSKKESCIKSKFPLSGAEKNQVFGEKKLEDKKIREFADKLYGIVGEAPIKEMIPFISKRNDKVAAFLVAIAKKESSFGEHSPSLDGQDCYNYWGYKGSAGRGTAMGYACFDSAEEAVKIVGDRIEVLVGRDRSTPSRMVDTWKCGTSCAGDPGAPGWVSTVAFYFEKILG